MQQNTAGRFDTRISIEYESVEQEPVYGTLVKNWVRLGGGPMWAKVRYPRARRAEGVTRADLELSRHLAIVEVRYRKDIDSSMRVVIHGDSDVIYTIISGPTMLEGRKRWLELTCEKYSIPIQE